MKWLVLAVLSVVVVLSTAEQYTDRYDDFDYDEVLANRRLLSAYIKCILNKGRCTAEGKELKLYIQDAIQTGCTKCTAKQKAGARKVVTHLKEKEQESWKQITDKYDPGDKYKETYEAFLNSDE